MGKASPSQVSFNAGELSPRLEGRVDLAKYVNGCKRLENFLPVVQGGVIKRSGTRFVKDVRDITAVTRLVPFEFGTAQAYMLEFGNLYVRVYKDSAGVLEGTPIAVNAVAASTPIEVTTTASHGYTTGDQVYIANTGVPGINAGYFHITVTGAATFTLDGTAAHSATGAAGTVDRVYQFTTPYVTADLDALQFAQSADVLYVAHNNYPPAKISRTGHSAWTHAAIVFDPPPFSTRNTDREEFMVVATFPPSTRLYSTGGRFDANMIGGVVALFENLEGTYPKWIPSADPTSSANGLNDYDILGSNFTIGQNIYAHYNGRLYKFVSKYGSSGLRSGSAPPVHEVGIQTDGRWDWQFQNHGYSVFVIQSYVSPQVVVGYVLNPGRSILAISEDITNLSYNVGNFAMTVTTATSHTFETGDRVFIEGTDVPIINNRVYSVTFLTSTTFSVTISGGGAASSPTNQGTVIRVQQIPYGQLGTGAGSNRDRRQSSSYWALGAFSASRGYPSSVAFFEDRLWWAGTESDPQGLWASRVGQYEDHRLTESDDGALFLLLNTQRVNKIEWLSAGKQIAIGTAGGEFVLSGSIDGPVTSGNIRAEQHSFYGSRAASTPLRVESQTLFVQRSGRKLIEFAFDDVQQGYVGADLTVLAHHVTLGRISKLAWAQEPDRVAWAVLESGELVGMTYDRKQDVIGWHRHILGGTAVAVESVAVIPHPDGDREQVWLIVRRTVNGIVRRHVEFFETTWLQDTAIEDGFFVDSGLTYDGTPATSILGLWHLMNTPVSILADGVAVEGITVSPTTGYLTLPVAASKVHVGLPFTATLETMRLEAGAEDGTAQGKTKRVTNVVMRLEETGKGLSYGPDYDQLEIEGGELFSGDTTILPWPSGYEQDARINLRHDKPTPCTLIALFPQLHTEDR